MARHNEFGKKGETLAAAYLTTLGYEILHCNWRYSHYEIDIIALKNAVLHFIEVKSRSSKTFGLPEDGVTKTKFNRLLLAADEFLFQHPAYRHVQYDILAITITKGKEPEFFLIEDVYL
ncbi:MAG TPA: YraN family protein [Chitinophagaceae bacterium]|nr:YraN family protein [Chitinophagaceae bacterium]